MIPARARLSSRPNLKTQTGGRALRHRCHEGVRSQDPRHRYKLPRLRAIAAKLLTDRVRALIRSPTRSGKERDSAMTNGMAVRLAPQHRARTIPDVDFGRSRFSLGMSTLVASRHRQRTDSRRRLRDVAPTMAPSRRRIAGPRGPVRREECAVPVGTNLRRSSLSHIDSGASLRYGRLRASWGITAKSRASKKLPPIRRTPKPMAAHIVQATSLSAINASG